MPISTPGWDNAPYISAAHFITQDPDNGIHNIGTYRAMIKAPDRVGCNPSLELGQGIYIHWEKYRARKEKMPAALCIGGVPAISYVAAQKLNYDVDEFAVAGGLVKAPIRVVKAKTVPLMVPADAEIIIEGYVSTEFLEPEAPFGESHGHVNPKEYNPYMEVTAITRRHKAILCSIISQVTPSESSVIKKMAYEPLYLDHLRNVLGIKCRPARHVARAADRDAEIDHYSNAQTEPSRSLARADGRGDVSPVDVEDRHRRRR